MTASFSPPATVRRCSIACSTSPATTCRSTSLKRFRQLGSKTPGHPERLHAPGIDVTTGPLGQGFANGVGMAIAERFLAAHFNRPGHEIIDHYIYGIVSDGDLMEGVAMEAASLAGHLGLGKLIYLYDQNDITLAAPIGFSFSEDIPARFGAVGWHVQEIDGMDTDEVRAALEAAQAETERPSLICARTIIGFGSPKADTFGVHGSPLGPRTSPRRRRHSAGRWSPPSTSRMTLPRTSGRPLSAAPREMRRGSGASTPMQTSIPNWRQRSGSPCQQAPGRLGQRSARPGSRGRSPISTRKASGEVINAFSPRIPTFIGGSADLNPSTNTGMKGAGDFEPPAACSIRSRAGRARAAIGATPGATSTSASASTPWAAPLTAWPRTAG